MQWAESCREAGLPGGNTRYHKGAARQGSPLGEEEVQGKDGKREGDNPTTPLSAARAPDTLVHTPWLARVRSCVRNPSCTAAKVRVVWAKRWYRGPLEGDGDIRGVWCVSRSVPLPDYTDN